MERNGVLVETKFLWIYQGMGSFHNIWHIRETNGNGLIIQEKKQIFFAAANEIKKNR